MKIDRKKLNIALARNCISLSGLRGHGFHPNTLSRVLKDKHYNPTPAIVGKIAKALNCDVLDIIEEEQING